MVTEIPGPRSREIITRKERVVADPLSLHVPAVIDHALGATFTDVDGNTMLDFSGGLGCHMVGEAFGNTILIGFRRSTLGLRLLRRRRENTAGVIHGCIVTPVARFFIREQDSRSLFLAVGPRMLNWAGLR
jgi:hypothetical protein